MKFELPASARVAADLSEHVTEELVGEYEWRAGGESYRLLYSEEAAEYGHAEDDPDTPLLVRRERDGRVFEVEIEVEAREVGPVVRPSVPPGGGCGLMAPIAAEDIAALREAVADAREE